MTPREPVKKLFTWEHPPCPHTHTVNPSHRSLFHIYLFKHVYLRPLGGREGSQKFNRSNQIKLSNSVSIFCLQFSFVFVNIRHGVNDSRIQVQFAYGRNNNRYIDNTYLLISVNRSKCTYHYRPLTIVNYLF